MEAILNFNVGYSFIIPLIYCYFSIIIYEIYYHRGVIHNGLSFHPILIFIFEFWTWLSFEKVPNKYYLCSHRIHHVYSDTKLDLHGHISLGISGQYVYKPFFRTLSHIKNTFNFNRSLEYPPTELQTKFLGNLHSYKNIFQGIEYGNFIFLLLNFVIFGLPGIIIYFLYVIYVNIIRHIMIDGLYHNLGYRNFDTQDNSKNLFPIGIIFGGSELHNNHHANPNSIKTSYKLFEFDIGWVFIKILKFFKLCSINKKIKDTI
jgi:stearoyl-CoA desaturase (Delta-9 desaturase)